ncbi:hypothetical protein SRB5_17880 [Streptomyces sp. RB5]|uniref:Uncharacterized protein n=1 Tax=Streptomyces smaragdinus TaxID=2585196 RepID=A0A7K0CDW6_9ACTN|nr:hypothetical protein [Streptomyces smaragdinus]MQY11669.1 hypothetical protein [Streptomyces smaragdinus]
MPQVRRFLTRWLLKPAWRSLVAYGNLWVVPQTLQAQAPPPGGVREHPEVRERVHT